MTAIYKTFEEITPLHYIKFSGSSRSFTNEIIVLISSEMKADAIHHLINIFRKIEYILDGLHYIN